MSLLREHPPWHARLHRRLFGLALAAKALEGFLVGRGTVYAGEAFAPAAFLPPPGSAAYAAVLGLQIVGAIALFFDRAPRLLLVAAALATSVDTFVAFQNTRLFLTVMLWLVALGPAPRAGRRIYWHLDATAWQVAIVYVATAIHKIEPDYLSGETLANLAHIPGAILGVVAPFHDPQMATVAAFLVVATELMLPMFLFGPPRRAALGITIALFLHLSMALVLPAVWTFSVVVIVSLHAFLPLRIREKEAASGGGALVRFLARWSHLDHRDFDGPLRVGRHAGRVAWAHLFSAIGATALLAEILHATSPEPA